MAERKSKRRKARIHTHRNIRIHCNKRWQIYKQTAFQREPKVSPNESASTSGASRINNDQSAVKKTRKNYYHCNCPTSCV